MSTENQSEQSPDDWVLVEQRQKIDTRTNLLRMSIGLNCGLVAGLLVHFLGACK